MRKLPVLTKDEVKAQVPSLRNPTIPQTDLHTCHTSGTTGGGLIFWETLTAERERWANWWRYRDWHGISLKTWCGYFGGRSLVPLDQATPSVLARKSARPASAVQCVSPEPRNCEGLPQGMFGLCRPVAPWVSLLRSRFWRVSCWTKDWLRPRLLRIISTGAESLLPHQRELVRAAFGVPVVEHYGQSEAVANFSGCEYGRLHVDEAYSLVEFVPLGPNAEQYRIIGTNWTNPAFPLLRYDVGDLATLSSEPCVCGRPGRVVHDVDGRREDYVTLPSGARVGRLDHIFKDLIHIREAQVFQAKSGKVILRVVKGDRYDAEGEEQRLLSEVRQRLGRELELEIEYHNQLARTSSGKLRFVVSEMRS